MKSKSRDTLNVVQALINRKGIFCTQSVHCSYYAVLQMMKYVLAHVNLNPIPYDKQDSNDGTSHEHLLKEIKNRINKKSEERSFSEIFRDLKKSRIMADYTDKQFDETESAECMQKAESLLYKLKHNFGDL